MAATATVQFNSARERGIYFVGIDRRLCASSSGLTTSALFQSALLSVSNKFDDAGNKINTMARAEIREHIGISPATVSRNNKRLTDVGTIEKKGINTYVFKEASEGGETKKWYCPTELLTEPFPAADEDGNEYIVYFTYNDCLVYSYYYTLLPHTGRNTRTLEADFKDIAGQLGIDPSTVSAAVSKLKAAKLIYFPNDWCGKNRYKKSKDKLKRGFSWFRREQEYKALLSNKNAEKTATGKKPQAAKTTLSNAVKTREIYYSVLQTEHERKAAQALAEALKNNDFRRLNDELGKTRFEYNNAIIRHDDEGQRRLSDKAHNIEERRAELLRNLGIDPDELNAGFYIECDDCGDTGIRQDGTACDCWKKRRRSSPPVKGKRTTKGIEKYN